jgi:rubrerythrin
MIAGLGIYNCRSLQLREALKTANAQLPNQKGKLTAKPTLRWIKRQAAKTKSELIKSRQKIAQRQQYVCPICGESLLRELHRMIDPIMREDNFSVQLT